MTTTAKASDRLYFVVRSDVGTGRAVAQALHAMDLWVQEHGGHNGTVIVYEVGSERELLDAMPAKGRSVLWHEPDLDDQPTALATDAGRMDLMLFGRAA